MHVKIARVDKTLPLPKYETGGSFAFDLLARETTTIEPKQIGLIPSNVIIKSPDHLALLILPRSSMPRKKSLIFPHSVGLIDSDYCGPEDEILIQVYNFGDVPVTIERGERIAQGMFVHTEKVSFEEVEVITEESRGGFGSTGS